MISPFGRASLILASTSSATFCQFGPAGPLAFMIYSSLLSLRKSATSPAGRKSDQLQPPLSHI